MFQITALEKKFIRDNIPDFRVGDTVTVFQKVKEGEKERVSPFTGLVIARKHGAGITATFTVRTVIAGVGLEKTFPLHSPTIERIEPVKRSKVRRAKLYYLRREVDRKRRRFELVGELTNGAAPVAEPAVAENPAEKALETTPASDAAVAKETAAK